MASSSKRNSISEVVKLKSKSFKTIIYPQKEKIEICPKFKSDWLNELQNEGCAYLVHPSGNTAFLELHLDKDKCYMTSGKVVSILFGIQEPTELILTYQIKNTCFTLKMIKQAVIEVLSSDEAHDIVDLSSEQNMDERINAFKDNTHTLHHFENDQVFGWEQKITMPYASETKNQVLHIPPKTAKYVLRGKKSIIIKTQHSLDGTKWTINTYTRETGKKEMSFTVSHPPQVMVVDIVRHNT